MNYIIKRRFCSWFFHQNISNDGENFYNLMIEIMEKISDEKENVMESLRKIFIEKNLIKNIE